jgi:hypothetical protein
MLSTNEAQIPTHQNGVKREINVVSKEDRKIFLHVPKEVKREDCGTIFQKPDRCLCPD